MTVAEILINRFASSSIPYEASTLSEKLWLIENRKKGWNFHVHQDAVYVETGSVWDWKVDSQYFSKDEYAAKYLMKLIGEKNTGIRYINRPRRKVPDICGVDGSYCRHPNECNTMLCSDCPVAEEFFASRDGVTLKYAMEECASPLGGDGLNTTKEDPDLELTDEMVQRIEDIDNAVYDCILTLAEKSAEELDWNIELIGCVTDQIKDVLNQYGIRVRHPAVVTDKDGHQTYEMYSDSEA